MWVRLQEAYGENNIWNADKQTNKTHKWTQHKTNKQKSWAENSEAAHYGGRIYSLHTTKWESLGKYLRTQRATS